MLTAMPDTSAPPPPSDATVVARTAAGDVRGGVLNGVIRFMGVPYAAPPVGSLRFAKPEPHAPWNGVRDAIEPGPNAPHRLGAFAELDVAALVGHGWRKGDDFLTANIWTPDTQARGLPVLVFVHGGAFVVGSNDAPVHDGAEFAKSGVVCAAINYRLGVEGFVAIPGAPANLGLHDQIAALRWVRDNIAAFGGDPANVTVSGESAGAMSVANLVASPLAKGLFKRAIVQSGHGAMVRPMHVAQRLVKKLAKILRVSPDVEGFRKRSMEECVDAVEKVSQPTARIDLRDDSGREPAFGLSRFLPVFGDDVLPEPPMVALSKGVGADVDLLIGTNREEMNLYFVPTGVRAKLGRFMAKFILRRVEPRARDILEAYGLKEKGRSAGDVFTKAMSDLVFRLPARKFAAAHKGRTHVYEFEWRSTACNGELGACHGLELPFVFKTLPLATGPLGFAGEAPPQALADRVHAVWVDFVRTGALPWPEYDGETRIVMSLASGVAESEPPMPAERFLP